jgi:hypothetical protein
VTIQMKARLLAAACCVLLLAGCGGKKDKADQRTASGEVLEGTISDSMLPLATVTSQPPRAKARATAPGSESTDDADATDEAAGDVTPGDAPPATSGDEGD